MENIHKEIFTKEQLEEVRQKWAEILQPLKEFMTVEEIAQYLGLSKSAIYKITSKREIPHYNPGGKKLYFKRTEVNQWIESGRVASDEEIFRDFENPMYDTKQTTKW